ncbi:MAG: hypothetical protein ABF420_11455 [Acetobacter syzygii]|uniref:hypothetical protein n=1 Tax=Acetobacter syzygii TaxID=146476 RepID=UPI0039EC8237
MTSASARAYGMRSIAADRDVVVRDPSGKGPMAYPTIAREVRTVLMGNTPVKHMVVFADGAAISFSPAWIKPVPDVPNMPLVYDNLAECRQ